MLRPSVNLEETSEMVLREMSPSARLQNKALLKMPGLHFKVRPPLLLDRWLCGRAEPPKVLVHVASDEHLLHLDVNRLSFRFDIQR